MENETKRQHTWLKENNVLVYGNFFEYKGIPFSIDRDASKFYAINNNTGFQHPGFLRKVSAIYWACQSIKEVQNPQEIKTTIVTTCTLHDDEDAQYYVNSQPRYEMVESNIIEITDGRYKTFKFIYSDGEFKKIS